MFVHHPKQVFHPKLLQQIQLAVYQVACIIMCYIFNFSSIFLVHSDLPTASSLPKLHHLDLIEGNRKTVRVIKQAAAKWEAVATRLYFDIDDITRIREDYHQQTFKACRTTFIEWLQGKGRTPTTWNTVIKALEEADLSELAGDLNIVFSIA